MHGKIGLHDVRTDLKSREVLLPITRFADSAEWSYYWILRTIEFTYYWETKRLDLNRLSIWTTVFCTYYRGLHVIECTYYWEMTVEVLHGWTRVTKRGPSCEMPSVAWRLVVRQSWHGAWYKRVYMWFLIIRGSRDVWIWWSQPTLPLSVWCAPQDCFSSSFCAWFLYLHTEWFAVYIVLGCCWWLV